MDHNLRVRQRNALALGAGREQERAHAGGEADADGGHVALDILHRVVDCHASRHTAAGGVDIELDVLVGVLGLEKQQLRNDQARGRVVDLFAEEDDTVFQQAGENVVGALAAVGLFNDVRD